jgi:hypothetical protein
MSVRNAKRKRKSAKPNYFLDWWSLAERGERRLKDEISMSIRGEMNS